VDCSAKLEYWEYKEKGHNIHLFCPLLDQGVYKFKLFRAIYKELKQVEEFFKFKYPYAVVYTKLYHDHMIRIITKAGYTPYFINLEYNTIWFRKMLGGCYV
jgi:hypothetical protein